MTGPCDFWTGGAYCEQPGRRYMNGTRCPDHTPAAIAGHPENNPPHEGTLAESLARAGRRTIGSTQGHSALIDDKAIASGKRRSNPRRYAEARAREDERRQTR